MFFENCERAQGESAGAQEKLRAGEAVMLRMAFEQDMRACEPRNVT